MSVLQIGLTAAVEVFSCSDPASACPGTPTPLFLRGMAPLAPTQNGYANGSAAAGSSSGAGLAYAGAPTVGVDRCILFFKLSLAGTASHKLHGLVPSVTAGFKRSVPYGSLQPKSWCRP